MAERTNEAVGSGTQTVTIEQVDGRVPQVFNDEHIKHIGLVKEMKTSNGTAVRMVGPPVVYSDTINAVRLPPPSLGQHTREILTEELNYSESLIQKLYEEKGVE